MKSIKIFLMGLLILTVVNSQEPTNWFFGIGAGVGSSSIDKEYPESASNQIGVGWANWESLYTVTVKDTGPSWEILGGYKHFINDWVGFRYYVNVSGQHYKKAIYSAGNVKADIYEYSGNADILINFYSNEKFSIGMLGGASVGGTYFDSPALDVYRKLWTNTVPNPVPGKDNSIYDGEGKIYQHHFNAAINVGLRGSYFQKIKNVANKKCDTQGDRRRCVVPISYLEHSFEVVTRIPLMNYRVTSPGDVITAYKVTPGVDYGTFVGIYKRPGYVVKNPYKITVRYIFAF